MKRILIICLVMLLLPAHGDAHARFTWYDVMYNKSYIESLPERQVYATDPGIGTFIWGDMAGITRHEDVIIYYHEGMVFHRDGRLLAYCPYWNHEPWQAHMPEQPPIFRAELLEADFSSCTLGELINRYMINDLYLHTLSQTGLKLLLTLEDGRALYLDCYTPSDAPSPPEDPTPAQRFAHTTIRFAEVFDFFAETRQTIWLQPGYDPLTSRDTYPHIFQYPNGYYTCDLARAKKLAQQEATP